MPKLYTIRDCKAEAYLQPMFLPTDAVAIRAITECVADIDHNFGRHPEDYALFCLGTFDEHTAKFEILDQPYHMVNCQDLTPPTSLGKPTTLKD